MLPWRALIAMVVLVLPFGCVGPTGNPATLRAIVAEARQMMAVPFDGRYRDVPESDWPPAIASLKPDLVMVDRSGVEVVTTSFFDGGWGYYVPRSAHPSEDELFRHKSVGPGVYWFHPH